MKFKTFLTFLILFFSLSIYAQTDIITELSLDNLYQKREFDSERFTSVKWLESGDGYTTLEESLVNPDVSDIVVYNIETGEKSIIVSAQDLIPISGKKPVDIFDYKWSPNNSMLLIFTNTERVWRYHTRGDYWIFNLESKELKQLGKGLSESSMKFAKFSPDNKSIGYVSENNIYVEDIVSGKIKQITHDGSDVIINGTTDWVYEEELGLSDAFRWSPDSKQIAYLQFDATGLGVYYMLNTTDSIYSKPIPVQYPKVGTTNSACKIGVISAIGGDTRWMDISGNPRNNYLARFEWANNSEEIMVQQLNRKQNENNIWFCNSLNGKSEIIFTDKDIAWLRLCDDVKWLNNGEEFTWLSDQNGWMQILKISRDGKTITEITPASFDVVSIEKIDVSDGWVYFIASPENATQRYLYRVDLAGELNIEKLSPANKSGWHTYNISADSKYALHYYSKIDTPETVDLITLPEHSIKKELVKNIELKNKLAGLNLGKTEFIKVNIGEVELDAWLMKPFDFNPDKKYPVIFFIYGEPAGQTVTDNYNRNYLYHQYLVKQGYVVMSVDNRGTNSPRGHEFRKSIYKKIGILSSQDQAAAVKVLQEMYSWVDEERIGIWGWSGGGSMTLNMLFRYPEIYSTGVSVAPVGGQWLYDTIYQERFMGLISENPEAYKEGSPVTYAHNFNGNLLLIHGTGDDNVHYQNSELVINELIKHNKQFQMFAYPNRSHSIYEGPGTTIHLYTMMVDYFLNKLEPGAK